MWKSPNGTIRRILNGTVFREPIILTKIPRIVPNWTEPIIIARHAYGDQYQAQEIIVEKGQNLKLVLMDRDGKELESHSVGEFENSNGVALAMFNLNNSIEEFAKACFSVAKSRKLPLFLSTKQTILKLYDGAFSSIFERVHKSQYPDVVYEHRLIDDMVAQAIKSTGGFVWACKNYDGDVQSDVVAQGYGSLGKRCLITIRTNDQRASRIRR